MKRIFLPFTMLLACGALLGACGDDDDDSSGGAGSAAIEPTLSSIQAQVLTPVCATSGCHGGISEPSLKAGETFASVVDKVSTEGKSTKKYVVPNKPDESLLYLLLTGEEDGIPQMPLTGKLTDAQIEAIRAWIAAGAKND